MLFQNGFSNSIPTVCSQASKDLKVNQENDEEEEDEIGIKEEMTGSRKRGFNVDSLLAPECKQFDGKGKNKRLKRSSEQVQESEEEDKEEEEEEEEVEEEEEAEEEKKKEELETTKPVTVSRQHQTRVAEHCNSPFSKLESDNQDVEKWKQTVS